VGPRAGLDVVEKIESLCTCQEFGPQSSILYPNHYTARMNEEKLQKNVIALRVIITSRFEY